MIVELNHGRQCNVMRYLVVNLMLVFLKSFQKLLLARGILDNDFNIGETDVIALKLNEALVLSGLQISCGFTHVFLRNNSHCIASGHFNAIISLFNWRMLIPVS